MDQLKNFGCYVLSDEKLKKYLSKRDFKQFLSCKEQFASLSLYLADKIANAIRLWAMSVGATHYTHWFFPLTNKTAEKQISFLDKSKDKIISKLRGVELLKGEVDASSFPSGSERLTFEARGYTVWDYTSPIFIKEDNNGHRVLYIPTAFCTYDGVAVDEKTPLIRSSEFLNREGTLLLHNLGYKKTKQVLSFVGGEQEYFLIDEKLANQRKDIMFAGRTLLGASTIIQQEFYQHYLGVLSPKISDYMHELNQELWKVGILAKLQHNEVAPGQHEIVPLYAPVGVSCDQNMLLMMISEQVAKSHGLKVLFHEKPFANLNGSGKHNNWSIGTSDGINLLDESCMGTENFLLILSCIIAGIDKYYQLLRCTVMSATNELRLGGHEAPPSIISVYIGGRLQEKIKNYLNKSPINFEDKKTLETQTSSLSKIEKDECDRNRTSPFAYTGTKFEFRMLGSHQNMAFCNAILNAIVASQFQNVNKELKHAKNKKESIFEITKRNFMEHSRILFNGDGYSKEWSKEAKRRGLEDYHTFEECCSILYHDSTKELLVDHHIFSQLELSIRYKIMLERYANQYVTEAKVLLSMMNDQILQKLEEYLLFLSSLEKKISGKDDDHYVTRKKMQLIEATKALYHHCLLLENMLYQITLKSRKEKVIYVRKFICKEMDKIREVYDKIEKHLPKKYRTMPTYDDLLFSLDN